MAKKEHSCFNCAFVHEDDFNAECIDCYDPEKDEMKNWCPLPDAPSNELRKERLSGIGKAYMEGRGTGDKFTRFGE